MLIYNQAFDIYHCTFRLITLLNRIEKGKGVELDRLRIWDFYLAFPNSLHEISLSNNEKDVRALMKVYISKVDNPYLVLRDRKKMFERIRPYHISALKCLASYNIINSDYLETSSVNIENKDLSKQFISKLESISVKEQNLVKLLTTHFFLMPLYGINGIKKKTGLMEYRYDLEPT